MSELLFFDAHTHSGDRNLWHSVLNIDAFALDIDSIKADSGYYSAGLHPWKLHEIGDMKAAFAGLEKLANLSNILAIGEAGLDKYYESKTATPLQIEVLAEHIKLATVVGKPLILHTVGRFNETFQLLKQAKNLPAVILHGFSENTQVAQMFWRQNNDTSIYTSFGADIFSRPKAADSLRACPSSLLLLETDAQTSYTIADIYVKAAELRGCSVAALQAMISENAGRAFGLSQRK
jgi:TatD DNase family protein